MVPPSPATLSTQWRPHSFPERGRGEGQIGRVNLAAALAWKPVVVGEPLALIDESDDLIRWKKTERRVAWVSEIIEEGNEGDNYPYRRASQAGSEAVAAGLVPPVPRIDSPYDLTGHPLRQWAPF